MPRAFKALSSIWLTSADWKLQGRRRRPSLFGEHLMQIKTRGDALLIIAVSRDASTPGPRVKVLLQGAGVTRARLLAPCARDVGGRPSAGPLVSEFARRGVSPMNEQGLDHRHRDKNGEISRKHGNTLVGTLRKIYGTSFAPGCGDDKTWTTCCTSLRGLSDPAAHGPRRRATGEKD
jgi:hypothetical protein